VQVGCQGCGGGSGEKGDSAAVPALVAAIEDPDTASEVRAASWAALEQIGGPEVIAYLVASITDSTSALRADLAAKMLGGLGNVEHNQILVEALYSTSACQNTGAADALVAINRADAMPLLKYLESYDTAAVYGPLIRILQVGTEDALLAVFEESADKGMAQCFLNSGNPRLEEAAEDWVAANGYSTLRIQGGAVSWGGG
jgi:HEAT repeat protein